jgi:hypothetical protein
MDDSQYSLIALAPWKIVAEFSAGVHKYSHTHTQINRPLSHPHSFPPALEELSKNRPAAHTRTFLLFSLALYLTSLFC